MPVAESIADGSAIDWNAVEAAASPEDQAMIDQLRILSELATLHRTIPMGAPTAPHPFPTRRKPAPPNNRWARLDLIELIGGGASGEVYRAWDRQLEREVALKLLRSDEVEADPQTSRILTEGRLLARVRHPNVVTVHGVTVHDGRLGLWMELVHGATLEDVLSKQGPFSAREATLIGMDVCRALAAIHAAGLIHRDIKAPNIMREHGGRIVLMDFGTGRDVSPEKSDAAPDLAGTPLYLAPEILSGESAGPRTDIYSCGILLYHLVTGSFPVRAGTMDELKTAHARGVRTRLRDARPDLPIAFVRVVDRAIASDPAERYASAGALEEDLVKSLDDAQRPSGPSTTERDAPSPRRQWRPTAILAIGAVLVLVALVWYAMRSRVEPDRSPTTAIPGQISMIAV